MITQASIKRTVDVAIPAHNIAHCIGPTLDSVFAQELPHGTDLRVHITDDGSSDDLSAVLARRNEPRVNLIVHRENRGRSAACNTAIENGKGDIVVVLDADCRFADRTMLARMLSRFVDGADAVLGTVDADGSGFWPTYAGVVSARRVAAARLDAPWHMTTANFAIRRVLLTELGGFSEAYRHYGFEDRDLLIRLSRTNANIVVDGEIVVLHREPNSVHEVCWKLYQSGRYTAAAFATRFPEEYARSAYRRFDLSRHRPTARVLSPLLAVLCPLTQSVSDFAIAQRWVGFRAKAFMLRGASALAYMQGTCHAALDR